MKISKVDSSLYGKHWNVTVPAPHGGVFVIGLGSNWMLFIVALLIGAAITAVILGLWKPQVEETAANVMADNLV